MEKEVQLLLYKETGVGIPPCQSNPRTAEGDSEDALISANVS